MASCCRFGCINRSFAPATIVVECSDRRIAPKMPITTSSATAAAGTRHCRLAIRRAVDQRRRTGEDRNRQERHAPQADQRSRLRQRQPVRTAHSRTHSRKAGQRVAAQPFTYGKGRGKREDARGILAPEQPRQRAADRGVDREISGQAQHRERSQPRKSLRIDKECVADPVETGDEIAEPEPVAGESGGGNAAVFPAPAPSISQTSTGNVRNSTGQALNGASASTDSAPAAMAMTRASIPRSG